MPEDEIKEGQVSEQVDEELIKDGPEKAEAEDTAFEADTDENDDEIVTDPEKDKEGVGDGDKEETQDDLEKKEEDEKEGGEKEEGEEEGDEDILRGREILKEEESPEKEETLEEEEKPEEKREIQEASDNPAFSVGDEKMVKFFSGIIPEKLIPDKAASHSGVDLDFKDYMETNPEAAPMMAIIADNLIRQLIHSGYLMTSEAAKKEIEEIRGETDQKFFDRSLTNAVPKAKEIESGDDYKKWIANQPKEIQALDKSNDPEDKIRALKRFLDSEGLEDAKAKKKDLAEKRAKAKEKTDAILKTTIRGKKRQTPASAMSPEEEEDAGFFSKDDDDEI